MSTSSIYSLTRTGTSHVLLTWNGRALVQWEWSVLFTGCQINPCIKSSDGLWRHLQRVHRRLVRGGREDGPRIPNTTTIPLTSDLAAGVGEGYVLVLSRAGLSYRAARHLLRLHPTIAFPMNTISQNSGRPLCLTGHSMPWVLLDKRSKTWRNMTRPCVKLFPCILTPNPASNCPFLLTLPFLFVLVLATLTTGLLLFLLFLLLLFDPLPGTLGLMFFGCLSVLLWNLCCRGENAGPFPSLPLSPRLPSPPGYHWPIWLCSSHLNSTVGCRCSYCGDPRWMVRFPIGLKPRMCFIVIIIIMGKGNILTQMSLTQMSLKELAQDKVFSWK